MAQTSKVGKVSTIVEKDSNGNRFVQYHHTRVVEWNDREIILNTNGWFTSTTRNRMNQASNEFGLDFSVYQKDHQWYVAYKGDYLSFKSDKVVLDRLGEPVYGPGICSACKFLGHFQTNDLWFCTDAYVFTVRWGNAPEQRHKAMPEQIDLKTEPDECFKKAKLLALSLRLIHDGVYDMSTWQGAGKVARALEKINANS